MKRQEVVALLKEMVESCKTVSLNHISLKTPSQADVESEGFELHIKDHFNGADWECLRGIVQRRNLRIKKSVGFVIIFTSKKP